MKFLIFHIQRYQQTSYYKCIYMFYWKNFSYKKYYALPLAVRLKTNMVDIEFKLTCGLWICLKIKRCDWCVVTVAWKV